MTPYMRQMQPGNPPRRDGESGQVAPLAAVGIFVMALMVLATMNLGQAVHQKIKLQNTADSAAYTLAAMEARTFNYIAFLNRAQLAHYNTAMAIQSLSTWVGYNVAVASASHDMLVSLKGAIDVGALYSSQQGGDLYRLAQLGTGLAVNASRKYLDQIHRTYKDFAKHGHQYAQALAIFNKDVIWHAQLVRAGLMNVQLLTGMQSYIQKLDGDLDLTAGGTAMLMNMFNSGLNSYEYYKAFDASGGVNGQAIFGLMDYLSLRKSAPFPGFLKPKARGGGFGGSKVTAAEAQRTYNMMANLANGTRYPRGVTNRGFTTVLAVNNASLFIPGLTSVEVLALGKFGQAKLTVKDVPSEGQVDAIRSGAWGFGQPEVQLSSDDYALKTYGIAQWYLAAAYANAVWMGGGTKIGSAIAAYDTAVEHTIYKGTDSSTKFLSYAADRKVITYPVSVPQAVEMGKVDGGGAAGAASSAVGALTGAKGGWPGFAPFFRFNANGDRTSDYGQPSTWIFLNKGHKSFQSDIMKRWGFTLGPQSGEIDATVGGKRSSYLFEGVNVISRGMVYYHRPGNWGEHPNFFNPFWRARLAPVGQKLQKLFESYGTSSISSSSKDPKVQALINGAKNLLGDAFTSVITSLIAH